jgi:hypothetical protein
MTGILVGIVSLGGGMVVGVAVGWWVRNGDLRRIEERNQNRGEEDRQRAARAVSRVRSLAACVATEVGEHSNRVREPMKSCW